MRGSRRYPTPCRKGSCRGPDKLETLIGESGSIGAPPTIVHAVLDALAPFDIDANDIRLFFHTALTREAARSRPARLKWSHLLNTSATTLRRYSLNILKELGKV
jgi:hypothetical protein